MLSKGSDRLADDHAALDQLLTELQTALNNGEPAAVYASLDLFWAKLAVHIRAEHLHLFPSLLKGAATEGTRTAIERLRADHEFFMHELGRAIETMRTVTNVSDRPLIDKGLETVRSAILQIADRLVEHNQIEENHVYQLAGTVLSFDEQEELARQISSELEKRPPRFAPNIW